MRFELVLGAHLLGSQLIHVVFGLRCPFCRSNCSGPLSLWLFVIAKAYIAIYVSQSFSYLVLQRWQALNFLNRCFGFLILFARSIAFLLFYSVLRRALQDHAQ